MTALVCDLEDQVFLAWRTGMSAAEIAARFNLSLAIVQSILDDVGGSAPTVPLADRHPSGACKRRVSRAARPILRLVRRVVDCTP